MYREICQQHGSKTIGQFYLTLQLVKKHFTDKLIVLPDLQRDLISGLNLEFNYKIGYNWEINGHQYIPCKNTYLCTSILLTITKPMVPNAGTFCLQSQGILIITLQAPTELKPQYISEISVSNDLLSELISLAVDHKINDKYSNLLNIPILIMAHSRVYIPKLIVFGKLKTVEIDSAELVKHMDKNKKFKQKSMENPEEIPQHLIPTKLLQSSFQLEPSNYHRQSMLLEGAQVLQRA